MDKMNPTHALIPLEQMQTMANAVAKSGLFGAKTPEQALTIMMLAQAEGRHPMSAAKDYDIINGKPSKKAEAMLRDFLAAGGKVEWHKLTDEGAEATFSHPQGGSVKIGWDKARMLQAKISNAEMYSKYPRAMYRSRCVSEGVRTVFPSATGGMYVPDEVKAFEKAKDVSDAEVLEELKVTPEQIEAMHTALSECGVDIAALLKKAELTDLREMNSGDAMKAVAWIRKHKRNTSAEQA
jgi:hypothetical protein